MARINTVPPEKAEGIIKEGYDMFLKNFGLIPKPIEMISASPALFELQLKRLYYFAKHPKLSYALLAHIRYLVSRNLSYRYCTDLNKHILEKLGVGEDDMRKMEADPSKSMLESNESAMLAFVIKSVKAPGSVTDADIENLKELGWEEKDIVDALMQGVSMIDHAIMMEVFQMDQNCMIG
jgi:alkylhydroperoxidase family enzyme